MELSCIIQWALRRLNKLVSQEVEAEFPELWISDYWSASDEIYG
jgi:hypothetical protein